MPKYSTVLMDHFQSPRNAGRLDSPDRIGIAGAPDQGPFMVFHLQIDGAVVRAIRFQTYGCGAAIAAGSMLTTLAQDRSIADCLAISEESLVTALGGLPPEKTHCAGLAIEALRRGLAA